jgi:hypothetical protein
MTTITINERTKAGKTFLEFAKNLPFVKINDYADSNNPVVKTMTEKEELFLKTVRRTAKHAREIEAGTRKGNSINNLMNDL